MKAQPGFRKILVKEVQGITEKAPLFQDLLIVFHQERIKREALMAAGETPEEPHPKDISLSIFGSELDVYKNKSMVEHVRESSERAKTIYAAMGSLAAIMTAIIAAESENVGASFAAFAVLFGGVILAIDRMIRYQYQYASVPADVREYFHLLREFHVHLQQLSAPIDRHNPYARLISVQQKLEELTDKMKDLATKGLEPQTDDEGDRTSGIIEKK